MSEKRREEKRRGKLTVRTLSIPLFLFERIHTERLIDTEMEIEREEREKDGRKKEKKKKKERSNLSLFSFHSFLSMIRFSNFNRKRHYKRAIKRAEQ
jgi:hypothetical protein